MPLTDYRCPYCGGHIHTDCLLDGEHALGCGEDITDYWDEDDGWTLPQYDQTFRPGEVFSIEDLPENAMNNSGKLEWVSDDTLALSIEDSRLLIEFKMAAEVKGVSRVEEDGSVTLLRGEKA